MSTPAIPAFFSEAFNMKLVDFREDSRSSGDFNQTFSFVPDSTVNRVNFVAEQVLQLDPLIPTNAYGTKISVELTLDIQSQTEVSALVNSLMQQYPQSETKLGGLVKPEGIPGLVVKSDNEFTHMAVKHIGVYHSRSLMGQSEIDIAQVACVRVISPSGNTRQFPVGFQKAFSISL